MKFTVEIDLENDSMQRPIDVVDALARVKFDISRVCARIGPLQKWPNGLSGAPQPVTDECGNTVGNWILHG